MQKQIVAVSGNFAKEEGKISLHSDYFKAIHLLGLYPVIVYGYSRADAATVFSAAQALVLSGGSDMDPHIYGQENENSKDIDYSRDLFEMELCKLFYDSGKPILGICRGMQVVNVAFGGTLHQNIKAVTGTNHMTPEVNHMVEIDTESRFYKIMGTRNIFTNSYHNQAVNGLGRELFACAHSQDGAIEALESVNGNVLCVQWHPERMRPRMTEPFKWLAAKMELLE